jgi:hypothetical protein
MASVDASARRIFSQLAYDLPPAQMRAVIFIFVCLVATEPLRGDDAAVPGIRKGMIANEVRQRLGPPVRIVREVLYRRHIEQWVYENPHHFRIQISCVRGEDPVVTGVIQGRIGVPYGKD